MNDYEIFQQKSKIIKIYNYPAFLLDHNCVNGFDNSSVYKISSVCNALVIATYNNFISTLFLDEYFFSSASYINYYLYISDSKYTS